MGLLSIFKRDRQDASSAVPSAASQTVQQARTRARRRLIGATLLVLMAIVGFPVLFESQPRPIPVDIPIEIPRPEAAAPLTIPPARSQVIVVEPPVAASPPPSPAPAETSTRPNAAAPASAPAARPDPVATETSSDKPPARAAEPPPPKPAAASEPRSSSSGKPSAADSARARALLEGREAKPAAPAAAAAGRFVVQVGAFADAAAAKEVRQKVEKLGLKTYTQVVETSSGSRTRVRVGPLESREQADKVLDRLKAAGVSAVVLTL